MESVLERKLLSPLAGPRAISIVDGIFAQNLDQALAIVSNFAHLNGQTSQSARCEQMIRARALETRGDFILTLSPDVQGNTPFQCPNPSVEMRPLGTLGWSLRLADTAHRPEVLRDIGARPVKVGERLSYIISPIPDHGGASGFDPMAVILALQASPLIRDICESDPAGGSTELRVSRGMERHRISCNIAFWMDGDVMHRDGHFAFARRAFEIQPQFRQQLFVDISSLQDDDSKVPYLKSPSVDLIKTIDIVRTVIQASFSARSPARRKSMEEFT